MHLIWTLLIGLVIGAVAKFLMPGKDPGGIIITMLIGIAGSFVATYAGRALGWYQEGQAAGFIMSVLGAIVLLALYHMIRPRPPESGSLCGADTPGQTPLTLSSLV